MDEIPYQSCGSIIKSPKMEQTYSTDGKVVYFNRKRENILSYVGFSKLCYVIMCFHEYNQIFGQEEITFPLSSSSRAIGWRNKILMN